MNTILLLVLLIVLFNTLLLGQCYKYNYNYNYKESFLGQCSSFDNCETDQCYCRPNSTCIQGTCFP